MGLIFDVLSAINNPNTQGNVDQLAQAINTIKQVGSENGVGDSTMQDILSGLGGILRPVLKEQGAGTSTTGLDDILGKLTTNQTAGLGTILTNPVAQQIIQSIAVKTGINSSQLQQMLLVILPSVMGLLKLGKTQPGVSGSNSLLNSFLDADRDGDVDLGDVFKFAGRFLNAPHA